LLYVSEQYIKFGMYTRNLHFVILLCYAVSNDVMGGGETLSHFCVNSVGVISSVNTELTPNYVN